MVRWILLSLTLPLLAGCAVTRLFTDTTSSEFVPTEPESLEARLAKHPQHANAQRDQFAVLIGANTELRHRGNLSLAYQVLIEQGYHRENIFVLDSEGSTPFFPFTDFTTKAALEMLFAYLAQVVEPHDTLFVYVTGHGRRITADQDENGDEGTVAVSTVILNPGEELAQEDFARLLERVSPGVGIAFFDQCYWGPFNRAALADWVTITTADPDETTNGVSFPRAFWLAFRGYEANRGRTTIFEAFKVAMVQDRATRLGFNRPRISHGYVDPARLLLTGDLRDDGPQQVSIDGEGTVTRP